MSTSSWLLLLCCESASRGWSRSWGREQVIWSPSSGRAFISSAAQLLQVSGVSSVLFQSLSSFPVFLINTVFDFLTDCPLLPVVTEVCLICKILKNSLYVCSVHFTLHLSFLLQCPVTPFNGIQWFLFNIYTFSRRFYPFHDHVWVWSDVSVCVCFRDSGVQWSGQVA